MPGFRRPVDRGLPAVHDGRCSKKAQTGNGSQVLPSILFRLEVPMKALRMTFVLAAVLCACVQQKERVAPPEPVTTTREGLVQTLERYRWNLESATDGQNRIIEALSTRKGHPVVFEFSGTRLGIQGPCNRMMGSYRINAANQLAVSGMASTNMACAPELMLADAALSGLLANPLQVEMDSDPIARLRLVSASKETLTFTGRATPEVLYGPSTLIFLEVSARHVECADPPPPNTRCLQVRERRFDAQGLNVGEPGAWRTLHENIEGFTHREGERNVLRVKRFNRPPASSGASSTLYVLDLIIETEIVTP